MNPTTKAILFIPDMSGFSNFVTNTEILHGQEITAFLIEEIISSTYIDFSVSEIEGDAVLFYKEGSALTYTLLSDSKVEASISFGLAFRVDDKYNEMLKSHNMSLEDASGETHHILPVPAVFVLDKEGVIQFEYVNPDYKVRLNGEILLKAAEQFSLNK